MLYIHFLLQIWTWMLPYMSRKFISGNVNIS
jgi:hypothetical protein